MKILHIEDNSDIAEPLGMYLESQGFQYEWCSDGRTGLQLIRENFYDVVLLDLTMPEFSGYDVIKGLFTGGLFSKQKVVVFTAHAFAPEEMKELMDKGVHSCLQKPVAGVKLLEKLRLIEDDHSVQMGVTD